MNDEEIEKQIEDEFCDVGIDVEGNLIYLEKLRVMCTSFNLEPPELLAKWFTYSAGKNDADLTMSIIDDFGKYVSKTVSNSRKGKKQKNTSQQPVAYDLDAIQSIMHEKEEEENMLQGYSKTPRAKGSGKRLHTTPEEVTNKRIANITRTPAAKMFTPSSFSPGTVATPSPKYQGRKNKGDVLVTYPQESGKNEKWQGTKALLKIRPFSEDADLKEPYKYMFQKISEKADVLSGIIESVADSMKDAFSLEDTCSLLDPTQNVVTVSGRLCCDAVGKLNSKSILLEGCQKKSNGKRVRFDINGLSTYSLFPGQVVTAKGLNSENSFIVKELYDGVRLPFNSTINTEDEINKDNFVVYVTCGPYATSDMLSHAPLADFLNIVEEERPDLVIMLGPFVDSKQPSVEKGDVDFLFEDKFTEYRNMIMTTAISSGSKIAFVPSQRDVFHDPIYPQPPFEMSDKVSNNIKEKIMSWSDPCTMLVNDVVFGITSTDVLLHLGAEEVSSFAPGTSDRLGRHVAHMLKQQSYYPLNPPPDDVNIDYLHYEQYCLMQISPDILIMPSDLRCFIKDVESCLCVNPGRLAKGHTGGTFAKILVKPAKISNSDKSIACNSFAQIVKI